MYNEFHQYDLAIKDFNKGISLDPSYGRLYYNRGVSYIGLHLNDLALKDYSKAISLDTTDPLFYNSRGCLYTDLYAKYDSGIHDFKKALQLNPDFFDAIDNLGLAYFKKGDLDNAITQYNISLVRKPSGGKTYYLRALVYAAKKEYSKALGLFETLLTRYRGQDGAVDLFYYNAMANFKLKDIQPINADFEAHLWIK